MGLETAFATVRQSLASGRVGTPVAARIVAHVLEDDKELPWLAARVAVEACEWLRSRPRLLFAQGDVRGGQLTMLLRLERGQSVLASVGTRVGTNPVLEAVVFGNEGMASCEGDWDSFEDGPQRSAAVGRESSSSSPDSIQAALRMAIQTRQAVEFDARGVPQETPPAPASSNPFPPGLFTKGTRAPLAPPYGVLLVAGDHTHQPGYAEAFRADPRCRLVGLCDENATPDREALNRRLAERWGLRWLPDFREAISRPDVHIASICAEPERRAPLIIAAAEAGRHLYLDKPLCATREEARQIVEAVRKHRVLAHMFTQLGWDPALRARRLIESGRLGELRAVHCDLCFAKGHVGTARLGEPRVESATPRHFELPDAKRELTNIGVYGVVLLLSLVRKRARRVFASTGNYFFAEHQMRDMEDFGQILLEMDGGVTASVTAGRTGWRSHPSGGLHRVTLIGDRGMAVIDAHRPRVEVWSNREPWTPPARDPADPLAMWAPLPDSPYLASPKADWHVPHSAAWSIDIARFLDCLECGQDSDATVELAAAATDTLLRAYASAAGSRVIT